jgi:hypothetical protein
VQEFEVSFEVSEETIRNSQYDLLEHKLADASEAISTDVPFI